MKNHVVKLYSLGITLIGCLLLILIFHQTPQNLGFSTVTRYVTLPSKPSNLTTNASMDEQPYTAFSDEVKPTKEIIIEKCNIYDGRWVYKEEENPSYDAMNCPFIEEKMSCQKNGRPDYEYLKWTWEPNDCQIPMFNGKDMMEKLRNKRVILVGDSLNRNMWESLACLLQSSIPSSRVELRENTTFPKLFWKAKDYNFTVEFYWSPFLIELNENHESGKKVLVLDKLSPNSRMWVGADVMVFNSGFWWIQTANVKRWDLFEHDGKFEKEMSMEVAYEKGMKTWATWIENNVDPKKTTVFFRSISAEHKIKTKRKWCYNKTQLVLDDESIALNYPNSLVNIIEGLIKGFSKFQVKYLNITKLSQYRMEAHPSIYRYKDWKNLSTSYRDVLSVRPDCSHWCLPGVPDTWNRLLYASLVLDS